MTTVQVDQERRNLRPRVVTQAEKAKLQEFVEQIHYSARYSDDEFDYRHVQLPKNMLKAIPNEYKDQSRGTLKLLWEDEWRGLGITQVREAAVSRSIHD
ncbi:MAG: Cyclin-dependent kinases regulatory subunit (Cell division control protein cks1) [Icmadophila ericetorum]|nr:Cyclin-dependent kinases regulatory subunit (Cell division control protein cks1) [Icmadophila ericetorum]